MLFFLRYLNPVIALAILVLCLISASTSASGTSASGGRELHFIGFFTDPISVYFLAKGFFCSTALFVLGKLLEQVMLRIGSLPKARSEERTGDQGASAKWPSQHEGIQDRLR